MTTDANAGGGAGDGTPAPHWMDGFDAETKGYIQLRGLDKKTVNEAFFEASKSHREAEKFVGAPASDLLRLPKDPNSLEWAAVHQRLGKPKDATEYDFASVKRAGDKPLDAALTETIRAAAFDGNLSKDGAVRLAQSIAKHLDSSDASTLAERTAKIDAERADLTKNWGVNHAANMVVAKAAAAALGVPPEAVAAFERMDGVGYAKVMEMFRTIGTKIGEDRYVNAGGGGGGNVMTRDQAFAEKKALMADNAWVTRYLNGGSEEKKKMTALESIIVGVKV